VRTLAVSVALLATLVSSEGRSQEPQLIEDAPARASTLELFQIRARYGFAYRNGSQGDQGPGLSYDGVTFNDLGLSASVYFIDYVGLTAAFSREAYSLLDATQTVVTSGALYRFRAGPVGRFAIGPVRLEPYVAYALDTLPIYGDTLAPAFSPVTRHGLLLAARVNVALGPVDVQGKFEVPVALAVVDPAGRVTNAQGLTAGGSVRVQILRTGHLWWGLAIDGEYVRDIVYGPATAVTYSSKQELGRFGLSVDVKWQDPPIEPPKFGNVAVSLTDAESGAPLAGEVTLEVGGGAQKLAADAQGQASAQGVLPGPVVARAAVGGYEPAEAQGEVKAGYKTPLSLKLKKEAPKVGGAVVTVTERDSKTPLADADVTVGDKVVKTDEKGMAKFEGLAPGAVAIAVKHAGHQPGSEAASVVAGKTAEVAVVMTPEKQKVPATLSGIVRSTEGGKKIPAQLSIVELKLKVQAGADGTFSVKVPAGTYSITISSAGFASQTKSVVVKDGDQAIFNVDLHPK
jgi:hypothetical protein